MNHIDELVQGLYAEVPSADVAERDAIDVARRKLRTAVELSRTRRRPTRAISKRHVLRVGLVTGLVAVAIIAVGALLPGRASDGGRLPLGSPAPASAKTALERAARAVTRKAWRPLEAGEWGYFRFIQSYPAFGHAATEPTLVDHDWIAANGAARFLQPTDVLLWKASPMAIAHERTVQRHGSHLLVEISPQLWRQFGLDYEQIIHLPTDPGRLGQFIARHASGRSASMMVTYATQLVSEPFLPPRLTAAFYRFIAGLPGVRLVGSIRDPLGRRGLAVSLASGPNQRTELIFNPHTGVLLSQQTLAVHRTHGTPAGTVIAWAAIDDQAVVHSDYQVPAARHAHRTSSQTADERTSAAFCGHVHGTVVVAARHIHCAAARTVAVAYLRGAKRRLWFRCRRESIQVANGSRATCVKDEAG